MARKLTNLANYDPRYDGKPTKGSQLDEVVWDEWAHRPQDLIAVAAAIRSAATRGLPLMPEVDEDDVEAVEGKLLFRQHRVRERNRKLRDRKINSVLKAGGRVACEACGFDFAATYGELGEGYIECHHLLPLHEAGRSRNTTGDLALVCSNCHRMIHRRSPWASLSELRALLGAKAIDSS